MTPAPGGDSFAPSVQTTPAMLFGREGPLPGERTPCGTSWV